MRCVDCDCRHPTRTVRWDPTIKTWRTITIQECWGVKEPFEIKDISMECTEYPEKRAKKEKAGVSGDMINDNMMKFIRYLLGKYDDFIRAQLGNIDCYSKSSLVDTQYLADMKDILEVLDYVKDECDDEFIEATLEEYNGRNEDA